MNWHHHADSLSSGDISKNRLAKLEASYSEKSSDINIDPPHDIERNLNGYSQHNRHQSRPDGMLVMPID
jgi:hypothetical protein